MRYTYFCSQELIFSIIKIICYEWKHFCLYMINSRNNNTFDFERKKVFTFTNLKNFKYLNLFIIKLWRFFYQYSFRLGHLCIKFEKTKVYDFGCYFLWIPNKHIKIISFTKLKLAKFINLNYHLNLISYFFVFRWERTELNFYVIKNFLMRRIQ